MPPKPRLGGSCLHRSPKVAQRWLSDFFALKSVPTMCQESWSLLVTYGHLEAFGFSGGQKPHPADSL